MWTPRGPLLWRLVDALRPMRRRRRRERMALSFGFLLAKYDLRDSVANLQRWVDSHPKEFGGRVPPAEVNRAVILYHERHGQLWGELRDWTK